VRKVLKLSRIKIVIFPRKNYLASDVCVGNDCTDKREFRSGLKSNCLKKFTPLKFRFRRNLCLIVILIEPLSNRN